MAQEKWRPTAIEYGLIAAGIAVAIIIVVGTIGTDLTAKFAQPQPASITIAQPCCVVPLTGK